MNVSTHRRATQRSYPSHLIAKAIRLQPSSSLPLDHRRQQHNPHRYPLQGDARGRPRESRRTVTCAGASSARRTRRQTLRRRTRGRRSLRTRDLLVLECRKIGGRRQHSRRQQYTIEEDTGKKGGRADRTHSSTASSRDSEQSSLQDATRRPAPASGESGTPLASNLVQETVRHGPP